MTLTSHEKCIQFLKWANISTPVERKQAQDIIIKEKYK